MKQGRFIAYHWSKEKDRTKLQEGYMINDQMNGEGREISRSGVIYEGHFLNDKHHGKGKFTHPGGFVYIGDFENDKFHGQGKKIFNKGKKT